MVVVSGMILHQRWRGNCGGTVANPEMKWSLNVMVAFSDSLVQCMFGGTSWSSILLLRKYFLSVVGNSFSIMWIFGFIPLLF